MTTRRIRIGPFISWGLRITFLSTAWVILTFLVSCDDVSRQRTLSKLFDGVPAADWEFREADGEIFLAIQEDVVFEGSNHSATKKCDECHDMQKMGTRKGNTLKEAVPKLCYNCHQDFEFGISETGVVHGPVATGDCKACHDPHSSKKHKHLLHKGIPELCTFCHTPEKLTGVKQHLSQTFEGCGLCHESHSSANKDLMKDDWLVSLRGTIAPKEFEVILLDLAIDPNSTGTSLLNLPLDPNNVEDSLIEIHFSPNSSDKEPVDVPDANSI